MKADMKATGVLYVVGTPIGNLEDVTLRALRVLREVDLVLCEDTRVTRRLLEEHGIKTPTMSYHTHSTEGRTEEIIEKLGQGQKIALVSDAGTPGISDPGVALVATVRQAFGDGEVHIESVPGPSAITAALSVSGVPASNFIFLGFVPHKKGRETLFKSLQKYLADDVAVVLYESPHRIMKTLESLVAHLTDKSSSKPSKVTICRELTKIHESVVVGSPREVFEYFKTHVDEVRGEWVVIISPGK